MNSLEALRTLCECANGERKLLFSDSLDLEKIIKQDLEVLQIIIKKKVDIDHLNILFDAYGRDETVLAMYNCTRLEQYTITMDELLKIERCLEAI